MVAQYLGERRQVNVRLPPELVVRIDAARGKTSRDRWLEDAAELALRPASQMVVPSLLQPVHECEFTIPVRTEYVDGKPHRTRACDCGEEQTA